MAYKDKDKQKEANKAAAQRRRDKLKGMTQQGMTNEGMTPEIKRDLLAMADILERPTNFGLPDCECMHCQSSKGSRNIVNHGAWKPVWSLGKNEVNRVSLPGDVDYRGRRVETKVFDLEGKDNG